MTIKKKWFGWQKGCTRPSGTSSGCDERCQHSPDCDHHHKRTLTPRQVVRIVGLGMLLTTVGIFLILFHCQQDVFVKSTLMCCSKQSKLLTNLSNGQQKIPHDHAAPSAIVSADGDDNNTQHIRYKHTQRHLPTCLIIGIRKGGTRALLEFLNLHPNIQAQRKEMHFFDDDDCYSLGLEWYRKKMPYSFPGQIVIEKTPSYFVDEAVPERVYRMNSSIKLLVVLRDPTERTISDYTQIHSNKVGRGKYHETFEELVLDPETGDIRKGYNAVRRSIYHRHFSRWLHYFPREQVHFVVGEKLVTNPVSELEKIEQFLGIPHKLTDDYFYFNKTRGFYCVRHDTLGPRCLAPSKGRTHPNVNPLVVNKLQQFFRPHNQRFYDLADIDFGWS